MSACAILALVGRDIAAAAAARRGNVVARLATLARERRPGQPVTRAERAEIVAALARHAARAPERAASAMALTTARLLAATAWERTRDRLWDRRAAAVRRGGEVARLAALARAPVEAAIRAAAAERQALAPVEAAIRAAYARCGYRRAEGRWAGGAHEVVLHFGAPAADGTTRRAWSKNGRWTGLDSCHILTVARDWGAAVRDTGLAVVAGRLVLAAAPVAGALPRGVEAAWAVTWVEQGRGCALRAESGYAIRDSAGGVRLARALRAAPHGLGALSVEGTV